ncbi:MAG TPA: CAP domain-containing protein [Polyangiales bacterium]|nr:CAP domain-containing protein [Polyangiales bacterium]
MYTASQITTLALSSMVSCAAAALAPSSVAAQATSPIVTPVSGDTDSWQHFTVAIPEGTSTLNVVLSGVTGDADLYVRFGEQPTSSAWDCRPYKDGVDETCAFTPPRAGTYHISLHGFTAFSGGTLTTTWNAADTNTPPTKLGDWKQKVLDRHNALRADHCAAPLVWDEEVAATAQAWSARCKQEHAKGTGLGENLAFDQAADALTTLETRVDSWYSEIEIYDFANPGFALNTGHFTQVVWRASSKLGCGVTQCPADNFVWANKGPDVQPVTFLVCRYAESGNITDAYQENVLPKPANGVCAQ